MSYPIDPKRRFGAHWGNRRPPGLPVSAPFASTEGYAVPLVAREAARHGLGAAFVAFLEQLADGESGGTLYKPANNFDARLGADASAAEARDQALVPDPAGPRRPAGKSLITAFGWDQANRDYWRRWRGPSPRPLWRWTLTPAEEIARPVEHYAELWREAAGYGLSARNIGRAVRLHHALPSLWDDVLAGGARDFESTWSRVVPADRRRIIDNHLTAAGL